MAGVRRFDLQSQSASLQFPLGFTSSSGPLYVKDIEVQPGNPSVVAIALKNKGFLPDFEGVAVFDNGVKRTNMTQSHTGSNGIEFSASPSLLYGCCGRGIERLNVDGAGVSVLSQNRNVFFDATDVEFDNGLLYGNNGQVADPETSKLLGWFPMGGPIATDAAAGRVYFIDWSPLAPTVTIFSFDTSTFLPVGFLIINNVTGRPGSFIRWGTDGLAFRTTANEVYFLRTSALQPFPTVTPTLTTKPDGIREFSLPANDIVYNPADGLIYASVPSFAGSIGNSIAAINPATGLVGQPVFIGSHPYKLALSDTGNLLYTSLLGAPRIRKFDVPTKTPGAEFHILGNELIHGPFYAENLAVKPGNPNVVAVETYVLGIIGGTELVLTDNGVVLPNKAGGNSFGFSGSHLYSYSNTSTEFGLRKLATTSTGFSEVGMVRNIVTGFGQRIAVADGKIFGGDGAVVETESLNLVGKFVRDDPGIWVAARSG